MPATFTDEAMQQIGSAYAARFGNIDEVSHPSILLNPVFIALLRAALGSNRALTRAEVESAFPGGISWEE